MENIGNPAETKLKVVDGFTWFPAGLSWCRWLTGWTTC